MRKKTGIIHNGDTVSLQDVPAFNSNEFTDLLSALILDGCQLSAYFMTEKRNLLIAVCSDQKTGLLHLLSGKAEGKSFLSITEKNPQAHLFEREIYEDTGFVPTGHPWLKPVRFPQKSASEIGEQPFYRIDSEEIHQVAVGPVHAGVIEPGHFRFQCHGEVVYHLEISLGYQHRGIEKRLLGGPYKDTAFLMETVSGDTTIGHMSAYAHIIESSARLKISLSTSIIRTIANELERCANHIGDIGALAGDAGFLPTQSYCGRIRGDFLNMTAMICGNRFGRGIIKPGETGKTIGEESIAELVKKLSIGLTEYIAASDLMFENPAIVSRLESIGKISREKAISLGTVGPAARACGIVRDVRHDFAYGYYRFSNIPVSTHDSGSVLGRAYVRHLEVQASVKFIIEKLVKLKKNSRDLLSASLPEKHNSLQKDALTVSLTEGWRGEICHAAVSDGDGRFEKYKIYDPSFHNWFTLAQSLRNQQISDFPLCNKSFNLSYCGHDL